jgi:hypothetical protein
MRLQKSLMNGIRFAREFEKEHLSRLILLVATGLWNGDVARIAYVSPS